MSASLLGSRHFLFCNSRLVRPPAPAFPLGSSAAVPDGGGAVGGDTAAEFSNSGGIPAASEGTAANKAAAALQGNGWGGLEQGRGLVDAVAVQLEQLEAAVQRRESCRVLRWTSSTTAWGLGH